MPITQTPPNSLDSIPEDLPIPLNDDACQHLESLYIPDIPLNSTANQVINLSKLPGWTIVFCYPMTGSPDITIPDGWIKIPGAAGCTPQVCSYREHHLELNHFGIRLYGLSTQPSATQQEAVSRLKLTFPLLSDEHYAFATALNLPLLEVKGLKLIKRLTLIINEGQIKKCFYPVFPPDKNVIEVLAWLSKNHPKSTD